MVVVKPLINRSASTAHLYLPDKLHRQSGEQFVAIKPESSIDELVTAVDIMDSSAWAYSDTTLPSGLAKQIALHEVDKFLQGVTGVSITDHQRKHLAFERGQEYKYFFLDGGGVQVFNNANFEAGMIDRQSHIAIDSKQQLFAIKYLGNPTPPKNHNDWQSLLRQHNRLGRWGKELTEKSHDVRQVYVITKDALETNIESISKFATSSNPRPLYLVLDITKEELKQRAKEVLKSIDITKRQHTMRFKAPAHSLLYTGDVAEMLWVSYSHMDSRNYDLACAAKGGLIGNSEKTDNFLLEMLQSIAYHTKANPRRLNYSLKHLAENLNQLKPDTQSEAIYKVFNMMPTKPVENVNDLETLYSDMLFPLLYIESFNEEWNAEQLRRKDKSVDLSYVDCCIGEILTRRFNAIGSSDGGVNRELIIRHQTPNSPAHRAATRYFI